MVWPFRRVAATLVAAGLVLGMFPQASAAHCESAPPTRAGHHDDHHSKDTERAEQCPHCPPAECRRHLQCAPQMDLTVVDSPSGRIGRPEATPYQAIPLLGTIARPQPPTPPPQETADSFAIGHQTRFLR